MGTVPRRLAADLMRTLGLRRAVETGTGWGTGAGILADLFPEVASIELSHELHQRSRDALADRTNVRLIQGASTDWLEQLHETATPTFYFLDAHWSAGSTAGRESECPLLAELEAIRNGHPDNAIVIDDARLFSAPPPPPHDPDQWPTFDQVVQRLRSVNSAFYVVVVDDQIVAVPPAARRDVLVWEKRARARQRVDRLKWWLGRFRRLPRGLQRRLRERFFAVR